MDWMSQGSRLPQLGRTNHVTEFVPRMNSNSSNSVSPSFNNSYQAVSSSGSFQLLSKFEDQEHPSQGVTQVTPSPSHSNSPISHEKLNASNGAVVLPAYHENVGGTTYFYQYPTTQENNGEIPLEPIAAATPSTSVTEYAPFPGKSEPSFFISDELRKDILNRNMLTLLQPDPTQYPELPQEVEGNYHELCPLEPIANQVLHKAHLGYQASMYKATHIKTGIHYCLRRLHNYRLQNTKIQSMMDSWKKINHSNIVQLKEVFTTKSFGDSSLIFVYSYHAGSETLLKMHFPCDKSGRPDPFTSDKNTPMPYSYQKNNIMRHQQNNKLPEPLIWNYIIQMTSALRMLHSSGLACRSLDPTKIIVTSKHRLRLSCLGIVDIVSVDSSSVVNPVTVHLNQQDDLTALGKLVLALACKSTVAVQRDNISTAIDIVSRTYTMDLRNLIMYLLTSQRRSVTDLMPMIGARFYTQLDNLHHHIDALDGELCKEVQNDRLFRLMTKLATINERPEFNMDSAWSETGDRYMLKLFRDYVFHQVTEDGQPWVDMAHIVQCLNKLDTGAPEKICLMSRDEQSILVVSYSELKHCLDQSFQELSNSSVLHPNMGAAGLMDDKPVV